ncbi:hypothetical protein NL676_034020 [Syzygium grande]|nr:hypothetical protein NL676_034020 [Syzygium grande]
MASVAKIDGEYVVCGHGGATTEAKLKMQIQIWRSTTKGWVSEMAALIHRTSYCLPLDPPLSHIPSPAAAKRLLNGNCTGSLLKHSVAET